MIRISRYLAIGLTSRGFQAGEHSFRKHTRRHVVDIRPQAGTEIDAGTPILVRILERNDAGHLGTSRVESCRDIDAALTWIDRNC